MLRSFVRSFIVNPELEAEAREAVRSHRAAADEVKKAARTSNFTLGVAAVGLVGLGAFLGTEEGKKFSCEVLKGATEVLKEHAKVLRESREGRTNRPR